MLVFFKDSGSMEAPTIEQIYPPYPSRNFTRAYGAA